jgi:hypothetical protein
MPVFCAGDNGQTLLRRSAAGCLTILLLALVYLSLAGPPQPIAPASFSVCAGFSRERIVRIPDQR